MEQGTRTALGVALALMAGFAAASLIWPGAWRVFGPLYLAPLLVAAVYLSRWQVLLLAVLCTLLWETVGPHPWRQGAGLRIVIAAAAFASPSLFLSEAIRRRRHRQELERALERERALRRDAEEQLRVLTETSPAAILTLDEQGRIQLANQAAHELLKAPLGSLKGEHVGAFFPPLASVPKPGDAQRSLRTALECKGRRVNGEVFPAHIWISSQETSAGPGLAAIILDTSEELRDRQAVGFDHVMQSSKILVRAVSHEIRNVCAAIAVVHANLKRLPELEGNEDFRALGTLVEGLGQLVSSELRPASERAPAELNLHEVLEELRIIIEPAFAEDDAVVRWMIPGRLPPVIADRHGLLHVFMNLARNSQRAIRGQPDRRLVIGASEERDRVLIRFSDTGPGVSRPDLLFQPFQREAGGSGLGLYLSRAILRSFAGDLTFEPQSYGACFVVSVPAATGHGARNSS